MPFVLEGFGGSAEKWIEPDGLRYRIGMVGWLIRATCGTLALALVGYVIVAIPVGRRTLFEHAAEIARTQPAQELASDVGAVAASMYEQARSRLASR